MGEKKHETVVNLPRSCRYNKITPGAHQQLTQEVTKLKTISKVSQQ